MGNELEELKKELKYCKRFNMDLLQENSRLKRERRDLRNKKVVVCYFHCEEKNNSHSHPSELYHH